jgi:hypothetical protein
LKTTMMTMLLALLPAALQAADGPAPGEYATEAGWGSLTIEDRAGVRHFALFAQGANGHLCDLSGTVKGRQAVTDDGDCTLALAGHGDTLAISGPESCRAYCGARAGFEGDYQRLPAGCTGSAQQQRRDGYLADYKGKRYAQALAGLDALTHDCGRFQSWLDKEAQANDRAITLLHLGRPRQCLDTLNTLMSRGSRDEQSLQDVFDAQGTMLPPTDWDAYLPIAKASWFNRRQCEAALAKAGG